MKSRVRHCILTESRQLVCCHKHGSNVKKHLPPPATFSFHHVPFFSSSLPFLVLDPCSEADLLEGRLKNAMRSYTGCRDLMKWNLVDFKRSKNAAG